MYSIDKYLTRELSEIYQIHDDLAEQIKKKMRFSGDYNVESRKVKERLFEMTEPIFNILVDEMKSTFRFFKKETGKNVNKIILTGGGALISGIDRFLHQKLKVDVEVGNFLTKLNLNESVDEKQFRSSANLLASAIGTARNELLNYNNRTINLIGGKMSKEKNVQNKVKVAAILLVVLLTGFFIKNDLKIKTQTYQKNIVMCGHILDELQQKIDSMQDSKTKIGSEVQLVGNKQAIRTSQLFRKLGNNVPTSLWLDRMKIKTEQIQSLDGLLKVVSVPRVQKKNRTIYQFEGRSVDKGAIKNFLHQIEGTAKWRKVTLTKIEWVGSNEEGIWEFTIQLIQ